MNSSPTLAPWEKDLSLALALREAVSVDLPMAEIALKNLSSGLGVPRTKE